MRVTDVLIKRTLTKERRLGMKMRTITRISWIVGLLVPMFIVTFCMFGAAQADQDKTITIYAMGDYSGPYGGITTPGLAAHRDVIKYWQDHNLIPGAKYKFKWADSGGVLSRATSIFRSFRETKPKPLLVVVAQTGEAEALRSLFEESKIILYSWGASAMVCHPVGKYVFANMVSYPDQFGFFLDYVSQNWDYAKMGRNPKVGILTWDTAFGRGFESKTTMAYAETKKVDVIKPFQFASVAPIDVSTQLLSLDKAGADWIYSSWLAPQTATVLKDMARLGLKGKIKYAGSCPTGDIFVKRLAGDDAEGFMSTHSYRTFDEDPNAVWVKLFHANNRKPEDMAYGYPQMVCGTMTILEAYKKAIEKVGWDKLDSDALSAALESLKGYDAWTAPVTYSPTRHSHDKVRMVQWKKGKLLPITDWREAPDMNPK
jgi:ABC-type branched-subunit amino acid transport system substrate-binding protein